MQSNADRKYQEFLSTFALMLGVKGRPFGHSSKPYFGVSDGANGVQWNICVYRSRGAVQVGVNLEGMEYSGWPISRFILSELRQPRIEGVRAKLKAANSIFVSFKRDAWQVTNRPEIAERHLGMDEIPIEKISPESWSKTLNAALACLDKERGYRGRAKQEVTLQKRMNAKRTMEVSPHLTIWTPIKVTEPATEGIKTALEKLKPIHDWISEASR